MTERRSDEELVELTVAGLDRVVLEPDTAQRLRRLREQAVARLERPVPRPLSPWIPAGAMATTLLAVGLLAVRLGPEQLPAFESDLQTLAAQELDLLEDIEFVAWMVAQNSSAGAG